MKLRDFLSKQDLKSRRFSTIAPMLDVAEDHESRPVTANLSVRDLVVSFPSYGRKDHRALDHINLDVRHGEIIGLVGESGSGKTTLARAIMAMVPQPGAIESGEVLFGGVSMTKLGVDALRKIRGRSISMMVPNPRSELNPLQTVGQQIANVAHQHLGGSRKDAAQKALDMLRAVRIPDAERRFNAYPHELSGGMAQRVIIAIALICSPQFIISDDATSGLDVTVQAQVLDLMKVLVRDQNASMLFITRDIGIAAHFCNRVAVMYGGEIVELGDTKAFFGRPAHPYSIMLLAAFSHNPALRRRWIKDGSANQSAANTGCLFRLRCVRAQPRCETEHPELRSLKSGHEVRCHFPVEALA
jgi:oligopeptide/dipeptide ABC transporter ATP-binding protein